MSEGQGLTPEQLGILLKVASAKVGKDPIQLKKELSDGSYDQVLGAIGADQAKVKAMMENRAAMEELLGSPQVQGPMTGDTHRRGRRDRDGGTEPG